MGLSSGARHDRRPQQLTVVRDVLPDNGLRTWLTDLKHALAGRVSVPAVVDGMTVTVANLSVIGGINRLQRRSGGAFPAPAIDALNDVLAAEKPRVAARIRTPAEPLYVENGVLCIGFVVDPELLRRAASSAIAGYCKEAIGPEHKAFRPLYELGQLTLGPIHALEGVARADESAYRQTGFLSAAALEGFCEDPNGYLEDIGGPAAAFPEGIAFGPMRVAVTSPQVPLSAEPAFRPSPGIGYALAWEGSR